MGEAEGGGGDAERMMEEAMQQTTQDNPIRCDQMLLQSVQHVHAAMVTGIPCALKSGRSSKIKEKKEGGGGI